MSGLGVESAEGTGARGEASGIGRRVGLVATCVLGGSLVALYAVAGPFVAPALRRVCLPFVPATHTQVQNVLSALRSRPGTLVDIGSGDGRIIQKNKQLRLEDIRVKFESLESIPGDLVHEAWYTLDRMPIHYWVIAAAREGFKSVGFELNPWLVWYSRYKAWRQGVHRHTSFYISDLWKVSFSQYTNVVIFGVPQMMEQLEAKLEAELQPSARVVACRFPFPTWTPDHMTGEGIDTVWVYDAKTFRSRTTTAKLLNNSEDKSRL